LGQDLPAIAMCEEHVRFMILAEHELCEHAVVGADQEAFNSHLNLEQINKVCAMWSCPASLGQCIFMSSPVPLHV